MQCTFCNHEIELAGSDKVGRGEPCPKCGRDLHCCYQCLFYDTGAQNQCRESAAEPVADKEKANFCDYFVFDPQIRKSEGDLNAARAKFDALFKKKS